jgi:hypothetical protein
MMGAREGAGAPVDTSSWQTECRARRGEPGRMIKLAEIVSEIRMLRKSRIFFVIITLHQNVTRLTHN